MSARLAAAFAAARAERRAALIGYLPAGFPTFADSVRLVRAMVDAGVDIVEVGLPYSDPLMDGPAIQEAVDIALRQGTTTDVVLQAVAEASDAGATALVMSYWNPVERYGVDRFSAALSQAGGVGLITPDLTPEEAAPWFEASARWDLGRVFLVAPSSTDARIEVICRACSGFVYAASTMGVTGARSSVSGAAETLVARVRTVTDLPVAVGLGVSTGEQAAEIAGYADGVIVGSAFIKLILEAPSIEEAEAAVAALARELAAGVRRRRIDAGPVT